MKKITLLLGALIITGLAFSQNFKITDSQGADITNSTHVISGASDLLDEAIGFQNLRVDSASIMLKRIEVSTIPGTADYFCWGDCFNAEPVGTNPVWYSIRDIKIGPSAIESSTHVYFVPNDIPGVSKFLYVYYDVNDPNDSVFVEIEFNVAAYVGISESPSIAAKVNAQPNPARDNVKITYSLENAKNAQATLVIVDLLGKEQAEFRLSNTNGSININTSDFKRGIYFYTIRTADQVLSTKKLIIN